jgi:hypothetical protein
MKTGEGYITFEVEGGGMQSVLVTFTAMAQPGKKVWFGKEEGTATILVYESKNIDVTKKIKYTATVCFDPDTLQSSIAHDEGDVATSSAPPSAPPSAPASATSSRNASPTELLLDSNSIAQKKQPRPSSPPSSEHTLPTFDQIVPRGALRPSVKLKAKNVQKSKSMLEVSPAKLDLGEVRVFEEITSQITLHNLLLTRYWI